MKKFIFKTIAAVSFLLLFSCIELKFENIDLEIQQDGNFVSAKNYLINFGELEYNTHVTKEIVLRAVDFEIIQLTTSFESEYFSIVSQSAKDGILRIKIANDPTVIGSHLSTLELYKGVFLVGKISLMAIQSNTMVMPSQMFWGRIKKFSVGPNDFVLMLNDEGYDSAWENRLEGGCKIVGTTRKVIEMDYIRSSLNYKLAANGDKGYYVVSMRGTHAGTNCSFNVRGGNSQLRIPFTLEDDAWHEVGLLIHTTGYSLYIDDSEVTSSTEEISSYLPVAKFGLTTSGLTQDQFLYIDKFGYYNM